MPPAYDVLIASDFSEPSPCAASVTAEVAAQARLGLRTGLVQIGSARGPIDHRLRRLVTAGLADWVAPRSPASAALLLLRQPSALAAAGWSLAARADRTLLVADDAGADVARVSHRVREELGDAAAWAPVGPLVRAELIGSDAELVAQDWHDVVDVDPLASARGGARRGVPVIGRTSDRFAHGWPESARTLLAAYPEARSPRVAVLGSVAAPTSALRRRPRWRIWSPELVGLDDFLAGLDVFVYFHASTWRDVAGRPILEALAAGVPVVTHPYFEASFGAACTYGEPRQAARLVAELVAGRTRPLNRAGIDLVQDRFGADAHRRRLEPLLGRALPALEPEGAPRRALFVTDVTTSADDVARLVAVSNGLSAEPLFITLSSAAASALQRAGRWADFLPPASGDLKNAEWPDYHERRIIAALRELRPAVLIYDGPSPPSGVLQAIAGANRIVRIWSLRGEDGPARAKREAFDLVVDARGLDAATIDQRCAPQPAEEPPEPEPAAEARLSRPARSAVIRYPYVIFVRPVRKATRRARRSWRRLQIRRGRAAAPPPHALPPAPARGPTAAKPAAVRVLLFAPDDLAGGPALDGLTEWVWRSPRGVVLLAPPGMIEPLRTLGFAAESLVPAAGSTPYVRLEIADYLSHKIRLLRSAYNCGPILFWGDAPRDHRQSALLRVVD